MRLISQDRDTDIEYDGNIVIIRKERREGQYTDEKCYCIRIFNAEGRMLADMATYSTEEIAEKVMSMLRKANEDKYVLTLGRSEIAAISNKYFVFPKESEVE